MPRRIVTIPARLWSNYVTRHPQVVITLLSFALLIALGVAIGGWVAARNAEQRVSKIEIERATEIAVNEQGKKISQVTTCFNSAVNRPLLTTILRALASRENDPVVREAFDQLISDYESTSTPNIKGPPTEAKCHALAKRLGINPAPYDPGS